MSISRLSSRFTKWLLSLILFIDRIPPRRWSLILCLNKIKTTGKTVKVEKLPKECINKFEVKIGKATKRILSGNEHEENVIRIVSRLSKNILQTEEEINKNYVQASEEEKAEKYVWKFTFEEDLHKSNPIDFSSIFNQMGDYWILKD